MIYFNNMYYHNIKKFNSGNNSYTKKWIKSYFQFDNRIGLFTMLVQNNQAFPRDDFIS